MQTARLSRRAEVLALSSERLNPLKARSTVAMAAALGAMVAHSIFGGMDPDAAGIVVGNAVDAVSTLIAIGGAMRVWWERRAPNMRLSFRR